MPPAPRRPPPPRRLRGAPAATLAVAALLLAALAGVVTTGVRLGTSLAPPSEDAPAPSTAAAGGTAGEGTGPGGGGAPSTAVGGATLPDRVVGDPAPDASAPPGTGDGTTAPPTSGDVDPRDPYPAVWPYATWDEVRAHVRRADPAFATAAETALRFARDVVGLASPTADVRRSQPTRATVAVGAGGAGGGGTTLVHLVRLAPGGVTDGAPWGVVSADGAVALSVPASVDGPSIAASVDGPGTPTVAVFDRRTWRGVAGAVEGSSAVVRTTPGPAGPAVVLALEGDPRSPASFTARRVHLGAGAGAPPAPAPAEPLDAVAALLGAVAAGDVPAVWELLDEPARADVLDWRGLAGRLAGLRAALGPFSGGPLDVASVATPAGSIALVTPRVTDLPLVEAGPGALALHLAGGAARLSSLAAADADWAPGPGGGLLVTGATRPAAVLVDGTVVASQPVGGGLHAPLDGVAPGPHLAVAVFAAGAQVTTATHLFVVDPPVAPPPSTPLPPAPPG